MRKFKCSDCQNKFEVPFGEGGRGADMVCPKCASKNVHRTWDDSLMGALNWGRRSGGGGQGRGRGGRGWWASPEEPQKEAGLKNGDQL